MTERWMMFGKRGTVAHLVDEEQTGWTRTEISGALVSKCGRESNEMVAFYAPQYTVKCMRCADTLEFTYPVTGDPLRGQVRAIINKWGPTVKTGEGIYIISALEELLK